MTQKLWEINIYKMWMKKDLDSLEKLKMIRIIRIKNFILTKIILKVMKNTKNLKMDY
jgi:hypothetical protein